MSTATSGQTHPGLTHAPFRPILVLNSGSSSLKAGLFVPDRTANFAGERPILLAQASGIGQGGGTLSIRDASGRELAHSDHTLGSQEEAFEAVAAALREQADGKDPVAVGHRIVHGGPKLRQHTRLTQDVLQTLEQSVHFAPLHLPGSLALVRRAECLYPRAVQVACFDTAFHRTMPAIAKALPIPREYAAAGVERFGFHGLSYESLVAQLRSKPAPLPERIVMAHLGSGSSLCAVRRGQSVDTTMSMTPSGGILMATRSGDVDPGVLFFMARAGRLSIDDLESLVNHQSGLLALGEGTGDMQQLEKVMADPGADPKRREAASLAFQSFATAIAKAVSALVISLRGLDLLIFTGGIGEHSAALRAAVVDFLAPYGFRLDQAANAAHAAAIGAANSKVALHILPAQEDLMIASHTRALCAAS